MGNIYLRDVHDDFALHCAREDGIFDIVGVRLFLKKYGSGPHCLRWGQEPTLKRQKRNVIRFLESTEMLRRTKQKANKVCDECGIILPRMKNKRNAHNAICAKLKS
jgi:hypothetical protein